MEKKQKPVPYRSPTVIQAQNYLAERKIEELFHFLLGHLLANRPDDPVAFLSELLEEMIQYREGYEKPPLVYNDDHIKSVFRVMDVGDLGFITIDQYETAMVTLGIEEYDKYPDTTPEGKVVQETFFQEAKQCLVDMLNDILCIK